MPPVTGPPLLACSSNDQQGPRAFDILGAATADVDLEKLEGINGHELRMARVKRASIKFEEVPPDVASTQSARAHGRGLLTPCRLALPSRLPAL